MADNNADELKIKVTADVSEAERKLKAFSKNMKSILSGEKSVSQDLTEELEGALDIDVSAVERKAKKTVKQAKDAIQQSVSSQDRLIPITIGGEVIGNLERTTEGMRLIATETAQTVNEVAETMSEINLEEIVPDNVVEEMQGVAEAAKVVEDKIDDIPEVMSESAQALENFMSATVDVEGALEQTGASAQDVSAAFDSASQEIVQDATEMKDAFGGLKFDLASFSVPLKKQVESAKETVLGMVDPISQVKMDMAEWVMPTETNVSAKKLLGTVIDIAKTELSDRDNVFTQFADRLKLAVSNIKEYGNQLGGVLNLAISNAKNKKIDFSNIVTGIGTAKARLQNFAKTSIDSFLNSGKGLITYSQKYRDVDKAIKNTQEKIEVLNARMKSFDESGKDKSASDEYKQWARDAAKLGATLDILKGKQESLMKSGGKYALNASVVENGVRAVGGAIKDALSGALSVAINLFKKLGKAALNALNPITYVQKGLALLHNVVNRFTTSVGRLWKMLRLMLVRSALRSMISGAKEGFQNLVRYSDVTNRSVSILYSSILQLKNALAAMIAPIFNASANFQGLASILNTLVQKMISAANAVNQVLSALVGNGKWIKAKNNFVDYAKSLDKSSKSAKKLNSQLQDIDELNVLNSDNDNDSGVGELSPSDMFEMADVEQKWKDFAEWLKSMWEKGDFTELGEKIGTWLKNALDSIPWGKIQSYAARVGQSIATLINGFVRVKDLGKSIGTTFAQILNTIFMALNNFVYKIDALAIGKFMAEIGNALLEGINWGLIFGTFVNGASKLAQLINSFVNEFNFDNITKTIANLVNTIATTIYTFFKEVDFAKLGEELGRSFQNLFRDGGINFEMIGRAFGSIIQSALDFVKNIIKELDFKDIVKALQDFFKGVAEECDLGEVGLILAGLLVGSISLKLAGIGVNVLSKVLGEVFAKAITELITSGALANAITFVSKFLFTKIGSVFKLLVTDVGAIGAESAGVAIGSTIVAGIIAAIGGFNLGKWLGEKISEALGDDFGAEIYKNFTWFGEDGFFSAFFGEDGTLGAIISQLVNLKDTIANINLEQYLGVWGKMFDDNFVTIKNWVDNVINALTGLSNFLVGVFSGNWKQAWEGIKQYFEALWNNIAEIVKAPVRAIISVLNRVISSTQIWGNEIIRGVGDVINGIINALNKIPGNGAVVPNISLPTLSLKQIPTFEQGGFPEDGWFRASRGEMIGKFDNGQSVVANNQQIVDGIANGVASANMEQNGLLETMIDYLAVIASKEFGISENDLFDAVQRKAQSYSNRTGNSAFA